MNKHTIEFIGIKSGDGESLCFDVTYNTYKTLKGEKPDHFDKSMYNDGLYRYYPFEHLEGKSIEEIIANKNKKYKVTIITEEVE